MANKKNRKLRASLNKKAANSFFIKKYSLILLQALFAALIGVSFISYRQSSMLLIEDSFNQSHYYVPSFEELRGDYYDSDIFTDAFNSYVSDVITYGKVCEELETNGEYDGTKKISLNSFMDPIDAALFQSDIQYKLDDLIQWGNEGVDISYKKFDSWAAYYNFFGSATAEDQELGISMSILLNEENENRIPLIEVVNNKYLSVQGNALEYYAKDENEYTILKNALRTAAEALCGDASLYSRFKDELSDDNTNIRYYVSFTREKKYAYTNMPLITSNTASDAVKEAFQNYNKYLYIEPGNIGFLTNTHVTYEALCNEINELYYPENVVVWIALDTSYPIEDVFSSNYITFRNASSIIPWLVLVEAISVAGFIGLFPLIIDLIRKYFKSNKNIDLNLFDKLPIEVSLLFVVLISLILVIGETIIVWNVSLFASNNTFNVPTLIMIFIDMIIALVFLYGYIQRIITKNIFDGSLIALAFPYVSKTFGKIRNKWDIYFNDTNVAMKSWTGYVLFLLFNTFFATLLFYSEHPVIAFTVLLFFDLIIGFVIAGRNIERKEIISSIRQIKEGDYTHKINIDKVHGDNKELAEAVNTIGLSIKDAVETSTRDEKLKASLITNVSHDLKTPLTSIINYVELLKRENIKDEKIKKYINVLDEKSQRLKTLTYDLVEASKITSGNITLEMIKLNIDDLLLQTIGEFEDRFEEKGLTIVHNRLNDDVYINADPRYMWRVIENLFSNVCKYALVNTRVYVDVELVEENDFKTVMISIKNISEQQLNIPAEELTERFVRGDLSRSTEGSGLGISIAKSLTEAQNGTFNIFLDGDLFKASVTFPVI